MPVELQEPRSYLEHSSTLQCSRAWKANNSMVRRSKANNSKSKSSVGEGIEGGNYLYHCLGASMALSHVSKLMNQVVNWWVLTLLFTRVV